MTMKVQFVVARKTGNVKAGTIVECLMRFCKKEGSMKVRPVGQDREVNIQRSRLKFSGYVRPTSA